VIDEHPAFDLRRRMDLYPRAKLRPLADDAREEPPPNAIKEVRYAVRRKRVYARIGQKYFKFIPRGGIVLLCRPYIRPEIFEKHDFARNLPLSFSQIAAMQKRDHSVARVTTPCFVAIVSFSIFTSRIRRSPFASFYPFLPA
jgi:hypothetical protein